MKTSALGGWRDGRGETFRHVLEAELARRCTANSSYSLRAFARFLRVDHATLSQILRGKRRVTAATIRRLSLRLGIDDERGENFVASERTRALSDRPAPPAAEAHETARTAVDALVCWQDWAILELTHLDAFVPDVRWIARVLDCSVDDVQLALHRLVRLGFLQMKSRDAWVDLTGDVVKNEDDFAVAAIERLAEELRRLALRAFKTAPADRLLHATSTIAVRADAVPEALAVLSRMQGELLTLLARGQSRDAVYHLSISFFPIAELRGG